MTSLDIIIHRIEEQVSLTINDARPDSIALFGRLDEQQQNQLARDAWTVSLRAISNAYTTAQKSRLTDIGSELMLRIEQTLKSELNNNRPVLQTF